MGTQCVKCGFSNWRALQVDHTNGGGRRETIKNGTAIQRWKVMKERFIATPEKYQLLCANCNWIKRYENNENGDYTSRNNNVVKVALS